MPAADRRKAPSKRLATDHSGNHSLYDVKAGHENGKDERLVQDWVDQGFSLNPAPRCRYSPTNRTLARTNALIIAKL